MFLTEKLAMYCMGLFILILIFLKLSDIELSNMSLKKLVHIIKSCFFMSLGIFFSMVTLGYIIDFFCNSSDICFNIDRELMDMLKLYILPTILLQVIFIFLAIRTKRQIFFNICFIICLRLCINFILDDYIEYGLYGTDIANNLKYFFNIGVGGVIFKWWFVDLMNWIDLNSLIEEIFRIFSNLYKPKVNIPIIPFSYRYKVSPTAASLSLGGIRTMDTCKQSNIYLFKGWLVNINLNSKPVPSIKPIPFPFFIINKNLLPLITNVNEISSIIYTSDKGSVNSSITYVNSFSLRSSDSSVTCVGYAWDSSVTRVGSYKDLSAIKSTHSNIITKVGIYEWLSNIDNIYNSKDTFTLAEHGPYAESKKLYYNNLYLSALSADYINSVRNPSVYTYFNTVLHERTIPSPLDGITYDVSSNIPRDIDPNALVLSIDGNTDGLPVNSITNIDIRQIFEAWQQDDVLPYHIPSSLAHNRSLNQDPNWVRSPFYGWEIVVRDGEVFFTQQWFRQLLGLNTRMLTDIGTVSYPSPDISDYPSSLEPWGLTSAQSSQIHFLLRNCNSYFFEYLVGTNPLDRDTLLNLILGNINRVRGILGILPNDIPYHIFLTEWVPRLERIYRR